jgi:hypothetical protein
MGHTKPESIADLREELNAIRALEGIKEKSPGIFYLKAIPFLHFHDKDGKRWADVKTSKGWLQVDVDFEAKPKARASLVKAAKDAHQELTKKKAKR